ncbi:MAG: hypothetical protein ACFCD0_26370 [Gemmataceae bacterium]
MSFPSMGSAETYVRKSLKQFKWVDVSELANGQTLINKSEVEKTAKEALEAKLKDPYAKVGLVKKNLVFRIKHSGGHYGKSDIIVIRNYTPPAPEETEDTSAKAKSAKSVLKKSSKEALTVAWWEETRGDSPDQGNLKQLLSNTATMLKEVQENTTNSRLDAVKLLLQKLEVSGKAVEKKMPHKDDKKIMQNFVLEVTRKKDMIDTLQDKYEKTIGDAVDYAYREFYQRDIDGLKKDLELIKTLCEKNDLQNADRQVAKVSKRLTGGSPVRGNAFTSQLPGIASRYKVYLKDLTEVAEKDPRRAKINKEFAGLSGPLEDLIGRIEDAYDSTEQDYDHPENAGGDRAYKFHLREVNGEFKEVLTAITKAKNYVKSKLSDANILGGLTGANISDAVQNTDKIGTMLGGLEKLKEATVMQYSRIRNESGSTKIKVSKYEISPQHQKN